MICGYMYGLCVNAYENNVKWNWYEEDILICIRENLAENRSKAVDKIALSAMFKPIKEDVLYAT